MEWRLRPIGPSHCRVFENERNIIVASCTLYSSLIIVKSLQLCGRRKIVKSCKYCLVRVILFFSMCFFYFFCFSQVGS